MRIVYLIFFVLLTAQLHANTPTKPASELSYPLIDGATLNLGWKPGDGTRRIIIARAGSPVQSFPQNGIDYKENTEFGKGDHFLPDEFVVYDNAFTSFFLTGLTPGTHYYFAVFEYNGTGANTEYLTSSFLMGDVSTVSTPVTQTSDARFSGITTNSAVIEWTKGSGARRLVVVREGSAVNANPVDQQPYTGDSRFTFGTQLGTGNYAIANSSGTSTPVSNLKAGTTYHVAWYEYNGTSQPVYKTPAYTSSFTTRSIPTTASHDITLTAQDSKSLSIHWESGNGQRRIVVVKQGSDITGTPVDGTDYSENMSYGAGGVLNAGEYIIYDGNAASATVTGITPGTRYYFKIFEYDGAGATNTYLINSFGSFNAWTATTPTQQVSNIQADHVMANSLRLTWAHGDGRGRMIVARKDGPVTSTPVDFTVYFPSNDFGSGTEIGTGNFVISNNLDESVIINKLLPSTTYHFSVFEYNGINQPMYLQPAATFSIRTATPLPVKLSRWQLHENNKQVQLQWTTTTELNSSRFAIQRSADGIQFTTIATLPARGNSPTPVDYNYTDATPLSGKLYYRLQMIDLDETSEYSSILSISVQGLEQPVKLLGNPVKGLLVADLGNAIPAKCAWSIINSNGQRVIQGTAITQRLSVNVASLLPGHYWLLIQINGKIQNIPVIIQQ